MPRALVTGGAGFIGSHVADLYLENGYDVTILDNFASGRRENVPARARLVELDLTSARGGEPRPRWRSFDVISHLGAQIDVRKSVADPTYDATDQHRRHAEPRRGGARVGIRRRDSFSHRRAARCTATS